ncbi:uncharacterized protein LOC143363068 [Halictus rubicundus]|uniref:uncharacterized protein LOC143363068 n=1 Tax=Halictus rubicundus TaxID=77578 RepID=UPI004035146F
MFEECSLENSTKKDTWFTLKDGLCNIVTDNDSNKILTTEINKQICQISPMRIIENLSLLGNHLNELPNRFSECLTNLVQLDLSNNQLSDLPKSLKDLQKLVYLNIDSNKFLYVPNIVSELFSLKTLVASNNCIENVPSNLDNLTNLENLELNSNKLKHLPRSYFKLNQLKCLSLANNEFKIIPSCVQNGMCNLLEFKFSQNLGSELNVPVKSVKLTIFCAEENGICKSFPMWLLNSKYKNLETVSLNKTTFQTFDFPEKPLMSNIKMLHMRQCQLFGSIIEKIIGGMTNLERLIIGNTGCYNANGFWYMPINSLKEPSNLKEIDVSGTKIPLIPKEISNFVNLTILNISWNNITCLPTEICSLRKLNTLIVENNNLLTLPKDIGRLTSLKELRVCHNHLCELPDTMETMNSLQYIDLYDNEFEILPVVLAKLPGLIGLDIEQNYFATDNLLFGRSSEYESMRASLRDRWDNTYRILNGLKLKSPELLESVPESRSNFSRFSLSSSSDSTVEALCSVPEDIGHEFRTEHWDTSEDSADEFDPNEDREPKIRRYPPFTFYRPFQLIYCPGDYHATRVKTRVMKMLREGTLVWPTSHAEGQFDDP